MHLITISNKEDANAIAHAVSVRFALYTINTIEEFAYITTDKYEYKITAEYTGKKRQTNNETNIACALIPAYAQAFYAGIVHGRRDTIEKALKGHQTMLDSLQDIAAKGV